MPGPPFQTLLITGGKSHDFDRAAALITEALGGGFDVVATRDLDALATLDTYDLLAVCTCGRADEMSDDQARRVEDYVKRGGGLLGIHGANATFTNNPRWLKLIGSRFTGHGPVFDFEVTPTDPAHPVVARTDAFVVTDELYCTEPLGDYAVFAAAHWKGRSMPMGYQRAVGSGRVLYTALGHDQRSLGNPYVQRIIQRAGRVAAGETFDRTLTVGILGYGGAFNMGRKHAQTLDAYPGASVVAACDIDPDRARQAGEDLGPAVKTTADPEAFVNDFDFDLCIEVLPHNEHAAWSIKALQAGKHVVTEKPLCLTLEEADAMIAAAQDAQRMLSCFHNRRWDGDFRTMLRLIRAGRIGEVFRVDAASANYARPRPWWRSDKTRSGGAMFDWGAHYCDWVLNLLPKRIASVTGDFQKRRWHHVSNEDYTYALIRFEDDTTATLELGSLAAIERAGMRVLGTEGGITNAAPGETLTLRTPAVDGAKGLNETRVPIMPPHWAAYYANVVNHLLLGEPLVVTPEQARRAIGVIALAEQSARQGGKPLPLPGEDTYEPDYIWPW